MNDTGKNTPLISAQSLSCRFGDLKAVDDISFELERGQILGFLGPNGAGKSTTMQMLTGNLAATLGRIQIDGIDLREQPKKARAMLGYLPEQPPLYTDMSVDEYLRFCAQLHGIDRKQRSEAIARTKDQCGLSEVGPRLIRNLSKGFQQRVGIAQAIIHQPEVIILDEPTVGLDPIQIIEIRELIKSLGKDHAIILSTHILPEVTSVCNRVQIMRNGRLVFSGSLDELGEQGGCHSIVLSLLRPPKINTLADLDGIVSVERMDDQRFRLFLHDDGTPPEPVLEALAQQAVTEDWGLVELQAEHRSLEQIFMDLTVREASHVSH